MSSGALDQGLCVSPLPTAPHHCLFIFVDKYWAHSLGDDNSDDDPLQVGRAEIITPPVLLAKPTLHARCPSVGRSSLPSP
jgi:hypothetical protein